MAQVLETLPNIAAEVSAPLAKTGNIVLLGGEERYLYLFANLAMFSLYWRFITCLMITSFLKITNYF